MMFLFTKLVYRPCIILCWYITIVALIPDNGHTDAIYTESLDGEIALIEAVMRGKTMV
jgi:hypothetical protein